MGYIRSCYECLMRTIQGQPPVPVVWFFVPWDTPLVGGPSPFRSLDWGKEKINHGIGEQSDRCDCHPDVKANPYYLGYAPAPYRGDDPCGTVYASRHGARPGIDIVFMTNAIGQPPCCESPFAVATGGEREGGAADVIGHRIVSATGGEREGGAAYVWLPIVVVCSCGGEREGGSAEVIMPIWIVCSCGGEKEGGAADVLIPGVHYAIGGEREGGIAQVVYPPEHYVLATGGQKEGGAADVTYPYVPSSGNVEFYASGTWTVPPGVTSINIDALGQGGAGGAGGVVSSGGGGGGGGLAFTAMTVVPGSTITIHIDSSGTWASKTGFAPVSTAQGAAATAGSPGTSGGAAGTGGTATVSIGGYSGGRGGFSLSFGSCGGGGGANGYGGGGTGIGGDGGPTPGLGAQGTAFLAHPVPFGGDGGSPGSPNGEAGDVPGCGGGGGAIGTSTGGAGSSGYVLIFW